MQPSKNAISSRFFFGLGSEKIEVQLISGLQNKTGGFDHKVMLEPLTGNEEESIFRINNTFRLPEWVNLILSQKVYLDEKPIGINKAGLLSVVDRDLLILHLRMLTFGTELWGITHCPDKNCQNKLDFTFDLGILTIPEANKTNHEYASSITDKSGDISFKFREPNGFDQAAISGLMATNPHTAWLGLLSLCITQWDNKSKISAKDLDKVPTTVLNQVDSIIADNMSTLDWDISFTCAHCNQEFTKTLDIQAYFFEELNFTSANFQQEVHYLAFFYHWSEKDILNLTRWKRKLYINYIKKQIAT